MVVGCYHYTIVIDVFFYYKFVIVMNIISEMNCNRFLCMIIYKMR